MAHGDELSTGSGEIFAFVLVPSRRAISLADLISATEIRTDPFGVSTKPDAVALHSSPNTWSRAAFRFSCISLLRLSTDMIVLISSIERERGTDNTYSTLTGH